MPSFVSKFMRLPLLTAAFGTAVLQGATPAQAQTEAISDAAVIAPQTAYTRAIEYMRLHYQSRIPNRQRLVTLPQDVTRTQPRWDTKETLIVAHLRTQGVEMTAQEARALSISLLMRSQTGPYSLFNAGLKHTDLPDDDLGHNVVMPAALTFRQTSAKPDDAFCLVLPQDRDFFPFSVDGLSREQNIRFFNRHEFWHCMEPETDKTRSLFGDSLPVSAYARSARTLEAEIFADLGAAADMIALDGDDTVVIDRIALWRKNNLKSLDGHDIEHYSGLALAALKAEITRMGLEAFRAYDHNQRRDLVEKMTRQYRLTPAELRTYLRATTRKDKTRPVRGLAPKVAAYLAAWESVQSTTPSERNYISLTDSERQQLEGWNIRAALLAEASPEGAEMTPQSLLAARARLLDRLRTEIDKAPADRLGGARIIKLEQAFQNLFASRWAPPAYRPEGPSFVKEGRIPLPAPRPVS